MGAKAAKQSLSKRSLGSVLWTATGSGAQMLLQLATLAILARLLTPADFGLVAATTLIFSFLALFSEILIAPALIQRETLEPRHVRTGFTVAVAMGFAMSLLFAASAGLIERVLAIDGLAQTVPALAIVLFLQVLVAVPDALAVRELEFRKVALAEVSAYAGGYMLVTLPLAYAGAGVWALLCGLIAKGAVRTLILCWLKSAQLRFGFERAALSEVLAFGGGYSLSRLFNMLATQGDNIVVGRLLGASSLGLYDRSYMLMKMPAALYQRVAHRVFFSALSRAQSDAEKLRNGFVRGVQLTSWFGLCLSASLLGLSAEIVELLLGRDWLALTPVFAIMVYAMYPRLSYKTSQAMVQARGRVYRNSLYQFIYAAAVLGGAWFGAHHFGLEGAAAGVSMAVTLHALIMARAAMRECGLGWGDYLRLHLPGLLSALPLLAVCLLADALLPEGRPYLLALAVKSAALLAVAVGIVLSGSRWLLGDSGLWLREQLVSRLRRRAARGPKQQPT